MELNYFGKTVTRRDLHPFYRILPLDRFRQAYSDTQWDNERRREQWSWERKTEEKRQDQIKC